MRWVKLNCLLAPFLMLSTGFLNACTTDISALSYTTDQAGKAAETARGVVISATPVKVSGSRDSNGIGTAVGALAGGVAGSVIGGGTRANILGGIGGATLGGVAGNYVGSRVNSQIGMQYQVRLRNGHILSVTQGMNPPFNVHQRVFVIFSTPARIVADPGN